MVDLRNVFPASSRRQTYDGYVKELCPFHGDQNPSILIWPNFYRCMACGAEGSAYRGQKGRKEDAADYTPEPRPDVEPLPLDVALDYHGDLPDEKRQYYRDRGITDESIDRFLLGYGVPPGRQEPRFAVPVIEGSTLINVKFRRDPEHEPEDAVKYVGVTGHNQPHLWGVSGLKQAKAAIIVGGELDRIMVYQELYPRVHPLTSTGGENTWRPEWTAALETVEKLYVALDSDQAGQTAQKKLIQKLKKNGLCPIPVELPSTAKDHTDFVLAHGHGALERLLPTPQRIWLMTVPFGPQNIR